MNKHTFSKIISSAVLLGAVLTPLFVSADEGMFLFSNPPVEQLKNKYNFNLTDKWLDKAMQSAVRFNNGGSGSFISKDGLVITNHHVASDVLSELSSEKYNMFAQGYLAKTRDKELKAPNLELNCLQSIEDVTDKINACVKPSMTALEASKAKIAKKAEIEKESLEKTGLRSDVVTLYQGGLYHLYRYKKYTDIRLVWAPEENIASFGGDVDNFEYPRTSLDVTIFRVYENNKPVHPKHYLNINKNGVSDGDLVFAVGHPGSTERLRTVDDIAYYRDYQLPMTLAAVRSQEGALLQYSARGQEEARQAKNYLDMSANSRKINSDMYNCLLSDKVKDHQAKAEQNLRSKASSQEPWKKISKAESQMAQFYKQYYLISGGSAFKSNLFHIARDLVRLSEELEKPSSARLREYRDSNLDSVKMDIFSEAPIEKGLEKARLTASLMFLAENLGASSPKTVAEILQGKTPAQRSVELVDNCTLFDAKVRKAIFDGGKSAIDSSNDPMIKLAKLVDKEARTLRTKYETEVEEAKSSAYKDIAQERFRLEGTSTPPDATFTLRLSYGVVKGYDDKGTFRNYCTNIDDLYTKYNKHNGRAPFILPDKWMKAKDNLEGKREFIFVSTADITGGNSGSPTLDRDGNLVGVVFDSNREGAVNDFVYDDITARCLSVGIPTVLEALDKVYKADNILTELNMK